jgi:hypothetical protein
MSLHRTSTSCGILGVLLLTTTLGTILAQQPGVTKSSISGSVVQVGSGEAIAGARVAVVRVATPGASPSPPPPPPPGLQSPGNAGATGPVPRTPAALPTVTTEGDGKFLVKDLDPGSYRIQIAAEGYARQEYGQKVFPGQGTSVTVIGGQSINNLRVPMIPAGNVSGTIRDSGGRPAVGVPVQLLHPSFGAEGQRQYQSVGSTRTDDRGEFRLYWVTPGRYYLFGGTFPGPVRPLALGGGGGSPNELPNQSFGVTFYPDATDMQSATEIKVRPGENLAGLNLIVTRQQLYRIRGRVIDPKANQPPPNVSLTIGYRTVDGGSGASGPASTIYDPSTGAFEFQDVAPGSYAVQVSVRDPASYGASLPVPYAQVIANVTNSDIEGVALMLSTGVSMNGHFSAEEQVTPALPLSNLRLQLKPAGEGIASFCCTAPLSPGTAVDGTFRLEGVRSGEYRASVTLPSDKYLKFARYNQIDILNQPWQFSESDPVGMLEVVIGTKPAQVDGSVVDVRQQAILGTSVVLIPAHRDRTDLFKMTTSDPNGHFLFAGVSPGEYKVFAWEAIEPFAWFDAEFMKQYEQQGLVIHAVESGRETVQLKMIPVGP